MAQKSKRPYGSGCLIKDKKHWVIRWRETEIGPDGKKRRVLRWETLTEVSKREASKILNERVTAAQGKQPVRSKVLFETLAFQWLTNILTMYKRSTQKNHRHILKKHLLPRFDKLPVCEMTKQVLQAYIADLDRSGYAPKTIDHIHDVLSAVLRTGVKWGHLAENPARGVNLPRITTVRPKWPLTQSQAASLLSVLASLPKPWWG